MPAPILPTFYYHDHFVEMLDFVERIYAHILDPSHHDFIARFRALSKPQQCQFIRMANRKGQIFHTANLAYAEIDDADVLARLVKNGFARRLSSLDFETLLNSMPKLELIELGNAIGSEFKPSWSKARLASHLFETLSFETANLHIDMDAYVVREHKQTLEFLLYLYFGKTFEDLKSFALRDLGIVEVNGHGSFKARFTDAAEAQACFRYSQLLASLDTKQQSAFTDAAEALLRSEPPSEYAVLLHAKLVSRVGIFFEKQKEPETATAIYQLASSPECNERLVRLLYNDNRRDEAKALLEKMIDDPCSDHEHEFAVDYYARKFGGQRVGSCTALLRESTSIAIDDIHRNAPEHGAVSYFRQQEWRPYRTENEFWHGLFGLLFWDELFGDETMLHSSFDWMPGCLRDKSFAIQFADGIARKLAAIRAGRAFTLILKTLTRCHGKPNGLFGWQWIDIDPLNDFLQHAPADAIATMMEEMCQDFYGFRDGFPDLMLAKDGMVRFVEIKAEGDAIRRNQLTRLKQLQRAGFDSSICRVDYRYDPNQIYVVVDIETTGGRAHNERVTEIGAVKMRNHEVLDEWHSLINPQRRIPAFITKLTGISNNMVMDAPLFTDVANDFTDFMGDAIFVAHNVNFDYGFIAQEYRRLDRIFRFPKFCTCAGMRRHYPGQNSYSLGVLCETFGIELKTHHRALCDAKAAAGLLSLINRKREASHVKDFGLDKSVEQLDAA